MNTTGIAISKLKEHRARLQGSIDGTLLEIRAIDATIASLGGVSGASIGGLTGGKGKRKGGGWPKGKKRGPRKVAAVTQDESAGAEDPAPQPKRESRPRVPGTPRPVAKGASLAQAAAEE